MEPWLRIQAIKNIKMKTMKLFKFLSASIVMLAIVLVSCENEYDLPEAGSIADLTPPEANFTFSGGELVEDYNNIAFTNLSTGATMYTWDFGDGTTTTDFEPTHVYPGEGNYTATLTISDALGVTSTFSETFDLVEPDPPAVPNPVLINADFSKIPKSSGSDCSCAGWINKDIGEQGESSSGNGGSDNVVKFDNLEPDHVYQEFAVTPNADYTMQMPVSFKPLVGGGMPSSLEIRILAGSGYIDGYTPIYYNEAVEMPQEDWGYTTVAQMEDAANNLLVEVIDNPGTEDYLVYTYTFNVGNNDSVALFVRGIGGPGGGEFDYNSGEEEIRADYVTIIAN